MTSRCVVKMILTIAGTDAANAAVALQTQQTLLLSARKEFLLLIRISTSDPEANVHSAADRFVWHNTVDFGVVVEHAIDQIGLLV